MSRLLFQIYIYIYIFPVVVHGIVHSEGCEPFRRAHMAENLKTKKDMDTTYAMSKKDRAHHLLNQTRSLNPKR